jgi:hypothetical protein
MITPDRESCCGVVSQPSSLNDNEEFVLMMNTWVGLALAATLLAIWLKISTALSERMVESTMTAQMGR